MQIQQNMVAKEWLHKLVLVAISLVH